MSGGYVPKNRFGQFIHTLEESFIALLLGLMVLVTFVNVVMRYGFNSQLIWGLELTLILFAWLVLFGISYGFKTISHLGVDAVINMVSPGPRRLMGILAGVICLIYALLLLKGGWDYWAPFAGLDATTGRVIPTGFANSRDQGWYETEQIPIPFAKAWLEANFNLGEEYEKMPRFVPYAILPFGLTLLVFRISQALLRLVRGDIESLIVSHEAEDAVEEAGQTLAKES